MLRLPESMFITAMPLSKSTTAITVLFLVATATSGSPLLGKALPAYNSVKDYINYRLPASAKPVHYKISLVPFLEDEEPETFSGSAEIHMQALQDTKTITLHYNDMDIHSLSVTKISANEDIKVSHAYNNVTDFFAIKNIGDVDGGMFKAYEDYLIKVNYTGYHRDDMDGFYRSYYTTKNGSTVWLLSTQFEPTSARRAFPCFDEPALKAKFEIRISRKANMQAMSNMPKKADMNNSDWDIFEETLPMSTYLVAFVVSDFTYTANETQQMIKVWSRKDASKQAEYGADIGLPILKTIEEMILGFRYELPKLDVVAVPDFSTGAMENWGLTTYRESAILYENSTSTTANKQSTATIIAHEFSHQWFGNVVSPEWWNYLWLNEGFASYFEYFAVDKIKPSWKLKEQFVVDELQTALESDAKLTTHPMTHAVGSPYNLMLNFDVIAYNKAASVIRMMEHFVTTDVFRKGLKRYLEINVHSSVNEEHLYNALNVAFKEINPKAYVDVGEVMRTWTHQPGFPLLTITSNGKGKLTLKQTRFVLDSTKVSEDANSVWNIPITYTGQDGDFNDTSTKLWMKSPSLSTNSITKSNKWYIFNVQQVGFYRVNYDQSNWKLLTQYLQSENYNKIHVINRAQIVDDALALAHAGLLSYSTALELVQYLEHEEELFPLSSALTRLSYMSQRLAGSEHYPLFQKYLLNIVLKMYNKLGFEEKDTDDHVTKLHRNIIVSWTCSLGHNPCIQIAKEKFQDLMSGKTTSVTSPDILDIVYTTGIVNGDEIEWNYLWNKYIQSNSATEKDLILNVLASTTNATILYRYLEEAIKPRGHIRRQDFERVFAYVTLSGNGMATSLSFLQNYYDYISVVYSEKIPSIFSTIAQRINTPEDLNAFQELIDAKVVGNMKEVIKGALEAAEGNIKWIQQHKSQVESWLLKEPNRANGVIDTSWVIIVCFLVVIFFQESE